MENLFVEFINSYGTTILYAVLVALAGWVATIAKSIATKYFNNKTIQSVIKTVVQGVEQMYADLDGEAKLTKAIEAASEMLDEKGIKVSPFEMRMLIEAAVGEFNKVFSDAATNNSEEHVGTVEASSPP